MKVKVIFYVRMKLFADNGPIEYVDSETVLDMGDLGVIHGSEFGDSHYYYESLEHFLNELCERRVLDKSQFKVVELGDY
jgi:hypothetical protein